MGREIRILNLTDKNILKINDKNIVENYNQTSTCEVPTDFFCTFYSSFSTQKVTRYY